MQKGEIMAKNKVSKGVPKDEPFDPNTDYFAGGNYDEEYFANSQYSKKATVDMYTKYLSKGMKMLHSEQTRDKILDLASSGEPIASAAKAIYVVLNKVDGAMRKSGKEVPDEVKAVAANELLNQLTMVGEASGKVMLSPQEKEAALAEVVNQYIQGEIRAGRIDRNKLAENAGYSVKLMSPNQRKQVDMSMKRIGATAKQSSDKYIQSQKNKQLLGTAAIKRG